MHDPNSYKHVKTTWLDMGDYILVEITYRGTNLFGATVTNSVTARVSLSGVILNVER